MNKQKEHIQCAAYIIVAVVILTGLIFCGLFAGTMSISCCERGSTCSGLRC